MCVYMCVGMKYFLFIRFYNKPSTVVLSIRNMWNWWNKLCVYFIQYKTTRILLVKEGTYNIMPTYFKYTRLVNFIILFSYQKSCCLIFNFSFLSYHNCCCCRFFIWIQFFFLFPPLIQITDITNGKHRRGTF